MTALVVRSDAAHLPLPDNSVDLVVTSPPYFALRSYQDGGEHYAHQIGSEATPQEFLEALWTCTAEWMRVLKPSGSIFVNLGDSYSGGKRTTYDRTDISGARGSVRRPVTGTPGKCLELLPERYRIGCVDRLGLIARSVIIWDKVNGLPESVTDRVRRSHEDWVHLTKRPHYYSAVDEIREPHVYPKDIGRPRSGYAGIGAPGQTKPGNSSGGNTLGKLPDSVWSIESGSWAGPIDFCPRCGRDLRAGNGRQDSTQTDTECSTSPRTVRTGERTDSRTSYGSDQSLTGHSSTTSAGTGDAFDLTTSNPSPSGRTSFVATPSQHETSPRLTAPRGTDTHQRTPTSDARDTGNARCVCESVQESSGPGSVWSIATEPLNVPDHLGVDHFAAFPTEWPRRIIQGWSPAGICTVCGEGRRPKPATVALDMSRPQARRAQELADKAGLTEDHFGALLSVGVSDTGRGAATQSGTGKNTAEVYALAAVARDALGGYAREYLLRRPTSFVYACGCPTPDAPTHPSVILDPFGGTGTTALCASVLGRIGITVDLSHDYSRLAQWRTQDPAQRAKAMRVEKPPVQINGQYDMFGGAA